LREVKLDVGNPECHQDAKRKGNTDKEKKMSWHHEFKADAMTGNKETFRIARSDRPGKTFLQKHTRKR